MTLIMKSWMFNLRLGIQLLISWAKICNSYVINLCTRILNELGWVYLQFCTLSGLYMGSSIDMMSTNSTSLVQVLFPFVDLWFILGIVNLLKVEILRYLAVQGTFTIQVY